ncbi:hypothetical protein IFM89_004251 [Coptis chinensis]|uniref:Expansin n=1 Tax=Coptis chinensis TaxID=261450 RepID=A0A835I7T8_9MAGN|nr:hypothetical protein IFM89_004251 [Coptis chinensis]
MAQTAWEKIGIYRGGIVPVLLQRVPCKKHGGVRFTINGRDYFELVLVITTDGETRFFPNIVPSGWQFGQTFSSRVQF